MQVNKFLTLKINLYEKDFPYRSHLVAHNE